MLLPIGRRVGGLCIPVQKEERLPTPIEVCGHERRPLDNVGRVSQALDGAVRALQAAEAHARDRDRAALHVYKVPPRRAWPGAACVDQPCIFSE